MTPQETFDTPRIGRSDHPGADVPTDAGNAQYPRKLRAHAIGGGAQANYASVRTFGSTDLRFIVNISHYEKVTLAINDWPVEEFMYLVEGRLQITHNAGRTQNFGPGDSFIMPKGFSGTWKEPSAIKKIAVRYQPPTSPAGGGT